MPLFRKTARPGSLKTARQLDREVDSFIREDWEDASRVSQEESRMGAGRRRQLILDRAGDFGPDFVLYDRKQDHELDRGHVEAAIDAGEVTVDDIVQAAAASLRKALAR